MQITNLSIFMSILLYSLSDILYDILKDNNGELLVTIDKTPFIIGRKPEGTAAIYGRIIVVVKDRDR